MTALLTLTLLFVSCGNPGETNACTSHVDNNGDGICDSAGCGTDVPLSPNADYTVNLSFYDGTLIDDVVFLYVYKGEESVHMKRITDSTYTFNLPRDNYTFEIDSYGTYIYDTEMASFSKTKTEVDLVLFNALTAPHEISVPCEPHKLLDGKCLRCGMAEDEEGYILADGISAGASLVPLYKGERSYFIFTPTESGVYKFTTVTDGCVIGNFGMPMIVQPHNISELVNNAFTATIPETAIGNDGGGTLQMVIGIDTDTADKAVILIERISDVPSEIGFTEMPIDSVAKKYTDLLNNEFVDIDITKANTVVYNETDGYYHYGSLNGPVVFIKITASGNSYLDSFEFPSLETVITTGGRLCAIFYENGEIVRKESYNAMIEEYASLVGSRGLVPLDKALADAVRNAGEYMGWWTDNSIFGDNRINVESAWLFACAYISENEYGYSSAPIELSPMEGVDFAISADADAEVYMSVAPDKGTSVKLSFKDAEGVTVTVGGIDYSADSNGYIDITVTEESLITVKSDKAGVIHFTAVSKA